MATRPFFLSKSAIFDPRETRMTGYPKDSADIQAIRDDFIKHQPSNLKYLLNKRYAWLNKYIGQSDKGFEIGCGAGLSKLFVTASSFLLTDCFEHPWVDQKVDALAMPYEDSSFDFIFSSNMIHHLARPTVFFKECSRVLKPGGKLYIQEINCSFFMRLILKVMRHEGYSYDVNVFDKDAICNDPSDAWSANCCIPNLLFDEPVKFEQSFPFKIIQNKYSEFILFPLSGGVNSKTKTILLPQFILRTVDFVDEILIWLAPSIFPLQRQLILQNTKE